MNYASIKHHDVANGPGIRVSLFVSGCTHHCRGCFNAEAWSFTYGAAFTQQHVDEILEALKPDYIQGLSLLGGEPFEPENQPAVLDLVRQVRAAYPLKNIWAYSGYTFEQLQTLAPELLGQITVLVDGPFVEQQKDLRLAFRGSANQRILDVPASLERGEPVLWKENP
ncbi:MAG: anaerobic ribonucleoside-triphosphate reductase activating protein [Clostridiales bacterium]|nr:anaerobic ribonucleoside-triphosphate reductase activating protein [Clostridiales bacterium]